MKKSSIVALILATLAFVGCSKKDLSKTIIRYLLANPEIKRNNEAIYEKALLSQSKSILTNPISASNEQTTQLIEKTALFDIDASKDSYTPQGAMQIIMDIFFNL